MFLGSQMGIAVKERVVLEQLVVVRHLLGLMRMSRNDFPVQRYCNVRIGCNEWNVVGIDAINVNRGTYRIWSQTIGSMIADVAYR